MHEGRAGISFECDVTEDRLAGHIYLSLESPDVPLVKTHQHEVKNQILDNNVEIALNFESIAKICLDLFSIE